jgi:transposase
MSKTDAMLINCFIVAFYRQNMSIHAISKKYNCHYSTVRRHIEKQQNAVVPEQGNDGIELRVSQQCCPSNRPIDRYIEAARPLLKEKPKLHASSLYESISKTPGFPRISPDHFRHKIADLRREMGIEKFREAYIPLSFLPGDMAQIDWGDFGEVLIGKSKRRIYCFIFTLCYSRGIFIYFSLSIKTADFIRFCHLAFAFFGGVPARLMHDNLKSAVIERVGIAIRFNSEFLAFATNHHFAAVAARPRRGNEKGRVERTVGYVRTSFFEITGASIVENDGKPHNDASFVARLNIAARDWIETLSNSRKWVDDDRKLIREILPIDCEALGQLPERDCNPYDIVTVKADKIPLVRYDLNDYSIPPKYVGRECSIYATDTVVRVLCDGQEICRHMRSFDRHDRVIDQQHFAQVLERKKAAECDYRTTVLRTEIPSFDEFIALSAKTNKCLSSVVTELERFLRVFTPQKIDAVLRSLIKDDTADLKELALRLRRLEASEKLGSFKNSAGGKVNGSAVMKRAHNKEHSMQPDLADFDRQMAVK